MTKKTATTSAATKKATTKTTKCATTKCTTKSTKSTKCSKSSMNNYKSNGITIKPATFSVGDKIKLTYTGLLSECGAEEIFAHIGWGEAWENLDDIKMSKTKSGFTATISVDSMSQLNLCFKDAMNNWDNNNGSNYTIYPTK
jgi:hypothetical protein